MFAANTKNIQNIKDVAFAFSAGKLTGRAAAQVDTPFLQLIGIPKFDIVESSSATSGSILEPACVMAMNPERKHTLELSDSVDVVAPDCHIYGNSTDLDDVVDPHTSANHLVGKSVQAVGFGHISSKTSALRWNMRRQSCLIR